MNIKTTVLAGLILIILLALALFFIPAPEKKAEISYNTFEERTDLAEIIVEYPSLGYEKVDTSLTSAVDAYVADFRASVEESGISPNGRPYILLIEDQGIVESAETVGMLLLVYQDFGGAHGMPQLIGLNFYKETGEQVSLGDMLALTSWTLVSVAEGASDHFSKTLGDSFFKEGAEAGEDNYASFLIEEDTVSFYFQPYQVAAYALGPQEYTISY